MFRKILLSLLLGLLFLWLALRQVSWAEVRSALGGVDYLALVPALPLFLLIQGFRALRLQQILAPLARLPLKRVFGINAIGFLAILSLPLRLGELVRPYLFQQEEQIPFSSGLAAVAVERVFDGLSIVLFFLCALLSVGRSGEMLSLGGRQISFLRLALVAGAFFVPAFLFLALLFFQRRSAERLSAALACLLPLRWGTALQASLRRFIDGLSILPSPGRMLAALGASLAVWMLTAVFTWLTFRACHLPLGLVEAMAVQAIICVGISIPGGPGFIGNFQLFGVAALSLFGVGAGAAFAFTVVNHLLTLLIMIGMGLSFLPRYNIRWTRAIEEKMTAGKAAEL